MPRCTRRSPATGCGSRSTARSPRRSPGGPAGGASGAGVGRGDRPVDGGDRARRGEPLLPRAAAAPASVRLGDTLRTTTEVVARRENRVKEGRRPTGLALLRIRTVDQEDRPVLDFTRCAMLPLARRADGRARRRGRRRRRPRGRAAAGRGRRARPRRVPRRGARPALRRRARRLGGRDRGRRRRRLRARARAADRQRRDGPPRRRPRPPTAAGSSTAATRSGWPPGRRRARCRRS